MGSTILGWIDTQTGTSGSGSTTYYATTDQLGSVTQVTNSTGTVVWASEYTPYGGLAGAQGTYNFTGFFTGKDIDPDTGLYYFNARWYDPALGRFVSEDPAGQGTNWYSYCGNNPQTYTDPSGKDLVSALIGGIIGAIVGGVTAWEEGYGPTTWQFWGDVGLDAGIGALAGAGDFAAWAGVTPGALAAEGLSGAAQAAIIGGVNAGVAGFITGFGNSLINGGSGQSAFLSGFEGLGSGLVLGGVMSYIGYSFQQEAAQAAAQQQQLDAFQQNLDIQQFQSQSNIQNPLQVATEDVAANTSNNTTVPSNTPSVLASDQESGSLFSNSSTFKVGFGTDESVLMPSSFLVTVNTYAWVDPTNTTVTVWSLSTNAVYTAPTFETSSVTTAYLRVGDTTIGSQVLSPIHSELATSYSQTLGIATLNIPPSFPLSTLNVQTVTEYFVTIESGSFIAGPQIVNVPLSYVNW